MMNDKYEALLYKKKHKDSTPDMTIKAIKDIIHRLGVQLTETWTPENEIGTYSLRLAIRNSVIGSNGKGMTRELARASAYAEFIERVQNNKMAANATFSNILYECNCDNYLFCDEKLLSIEQLKNENNSFMRYFYETRNDEEKKKDKIELLEEYQKLDYNISRSNKYICIPYYSIKEKADVLVPYCIQNMFYGSNGMCAGNTVEEALVQGLSEIFERYVQTQLIMNKLCLPDIPEYYIKRFPDIYNMYKEIQNNKQYCVFMKDGSLGGQFPVCVLIIVNQNTGWFGVKIGAHPDYNVAMERLFTEALQGIDLDLFSKKTYFNFNNINVCNRNNLQNAFKTGDAAYPYELFKDKPDFEFVEPKNFSKATNKEMLEYALRIIKDRGYDVLIHDVSYLGFPSYHIIVPGFSEMNIPTKNDFEADNTRFHLQKLVMHPDKINENNIKYLVSVISYYQHSLQSNSFKDFSGFLCDDVCIGKKYGIDLLYFKCMLFVYQKDFLNAKKTMELILLIMGKDNLETENGMFIKSVDFYLQGMLALGEHKDVICCLKNIFSEDIINKVDDIFCQPEEILVKQYRVYDDDYRSSDYKELLELTRNYLKMQGVSHKNGNKVIEELDL